jgi:hypothetical protein
MTPEPLMRWLTNHPRTLAYIAFIATVTFLIDLVRVAT